MIKVFYDDKCNLCRREIERNFLITKSIRNEIMKKFYIISLIAVGLISIVGVFAGPITSNVEKPDYEIITSQKNIEIRRYGPMIIAEVETAVNREDTIGNEFGILADYIFGNNTMQNGIAMTAPVQQQKSRKIAMTSPVQQQLADEVWTTSFVMPSEYNMDTLPKPNNDRVQLKEVPPKKFVVVQFSGTNSDENINEHEKQLTEYIVSNQIKTVGTFKYAFYDPPWTLPIMRRNEVMVEIE